MRQARAIHGRAPAASAGMQPLPGPRRGQGGRRVGVQPARKAKKKKKEKDTMQQGSCQSREDSGSPDPMPRARVLAAFRHTRP